MATNKCKAVTDVQYELNKNGDKGEVAMMTGGPLE